MPILLAARKDLTASGTAQTNRLVRALLLAGGDTECRLARGELAATEPPVRRRPWRPEGGHRAEHAEDWRWDVVWRGAVGQREPSGEGPTEGVRKRPNKRPGVRSGARKRCSRGCS
jgi:hypothetical protein